MPNANLGKFVVLLLLFRVYYWVINFGFGCLMRNSSAAVSAKSTDMTLTPIPLSADRYRSEQSDGVQSTFR